MIVRRARAVCACALAAGCQAPDAPSFGQVSGNALGTTWTVRWAPVDAPDAGEVEAVTDRVLAEVDAAMSTWRDDSELMRVRQGPGPVVVSEDTAAVVAAALDVAAATGGAFDPTVQPLMALWGLHGTPRTTWPTDDELDAARAQIGWSRVVVGRGPGGPTVDADGTTLDLSAIAKGHAVDRVFVALAAAGAADLLVEVGGEVRSAGRSPRGGAWSVGIDRPVVGRVPGQDLVGVANLTNLAVATSGNYRSRVEIEGRTVHHTMDPRTGMPAVSPARSATVIAPDARAADAWATVLMVLGEGGLPLVAARPGLEAWLLVEGDDGSLSVRATDGATRHIQALAVEVTAAGE